MIGIGHPRQVHFWKNIVRNLMDDGHDVKIVAWKKDILLDLLNAYGLEYEVIGKNYKGLIKKAYGMFENDIKLFKIAKKFKPNILMGGSPYLAHVSKSIGKPYIYFFETEHAHISYWLTYPFADVICSPSCLKREINPKKRVRYDGYSYFTYLHPDHFTPDPSVLGDLGLTTDDKFIIVRFVAWKASHDINQSGIRNSMWAEYVSKIGRHGRVFISSEAKLEKDFGKYKLNIPPEKFHSLLSYALLYIGEGGSTATEAAILGTPSIHISSTAKFCGVFDDLFNKYNLIYTFDNDQKALKKAVEIISNPLSKEMWMARRDAMLKEKIDVTKFMTEFIEGYPESFQRMKRNEV